MMLTMKHNDCANYSLMGTYSIGKIIIAYSATNVKKIFFFFSEFCIIHIFTYLQTVIFFI